MSRNLAHDPRIGSALYLIGAGFVAAAPFTTMDYQRLQFGDSIATNGQSLSLNGVVTYAEDGWGHVHGASNTFVTTLPGSQGALLTVSTWSVGFVCLAAAGLLAATALFTGAAAFAPGRRDQLIRRTVIANALAVLAFGALIVVAVDEVLRVRGLQHTATGLPDATVRFGPGVALLLAGIGCCVAALTSRIRPMWHQLGVLDGPPPGSRPIEHAEAADVLDLDLLGPSY